LVDAVRVSRLGSASIAASPRCAPSAARQSGMTSALASSKPQARLTLPIVRACAAGAATTPSADFCATVRAPCDVLVHESVTHADLPEISSTAFVTRPPDLPPALMDMGFAITASLARHRKPRHPVLVHRPVFAPRFLPTPSRDNTLARGTGLSPVATEHARHTGKKGAVSRHPLAAKLRTIPPRI